jgi:O-antigen ligase
MAQLRWRVPRVGPAGVGLAVVGLAIFLGLASAVLPGSFLFAVLLVPGIAALVLVRPEYTLTACVGLVCGLIHPALVPRIPVFGGALAAADATLVMLSGYAMWVAATQRGQTSAAPVAGARLLGVSLALFGVCFALAVALSLTVRDINPAHVLGETRDLLYLAFLPVAVVILRQRERQKRFVVSFVVLGCLFAAGQVLQGVFNIPVFGSQGISALETLGQQHEGTTRANTLGLNVMVFALLLTLGAHVLGLIHRGLFYLVGGLLFVGIVLTFGRTTYAAVLVCMLVVVWWLDAKRLPLFLCALVLVVLAASGIGMLLKPDSFAAVYFRMTTIGEEIDRGYSAQWRFWEMEAMLPHLQEHPLVGVGLGADYKGGRGSSVTPELNRYVHNGYLYMAGKMGLPALAFFLLMMASIAAIGRRSAKSADSPWTRVVGAASAAMMIRFLAASITEPHLMSDYGVVVIAVAGALVYLSARSAPAAPGEAAGAKRAPAPIRRIRTRGWAG